MASADQPDFGDRAVARLLARFTEQTAIRRLARGLTGELLLADHGGDIVGPTLVHDADECRAGVYVPAKRGAHDEDMVARLRRPMPEWGPRHRVLYERGIRYGFPEQHFLQVEFQNAWTAIDPRFNSMRTDVPHSFGVHWTIGRKPWQNLGNPARSVSLTLWSMAWETLRLHQPEMCAELEQRGLVRDKPE